MPIPDNIFGAKGMYMVELDANHNVLRVKRKGRPEYDQPEGMAGVYRDTPLQVVRTDVPGNTLYCWYRTSTGQYIKVPC
jgi:hypothetical protein